MRGFGEGRPGGEAPGTVRGGAKGDRPSGNAPGTVLGGAGMDNYKWTQQ